MRRASFPDRRLQWIIDESVRADRVQDNAPTYFYGLPTEVQRGDYRAKFGELVRCAPYTGVSQRIDLPQVDTRFVGQPIAISNLTSVTTDIRVHASPGATIGGREYVDIVEPYDTLVLVPVTETLWLTKVSASTSTDANNRDYIDDFIGTELDPSRWQADNKSGAIALTGAGQLKISVPASTIADWWTNVSTAPHIHFIPPIGLAPSSGVVWGEIRVVDWSVPGNNTQFGIALINKAEYSVGLNVRGYWTALDGANGASWTDIGNTVGIDSQTGLSTPSFSAPHRYRVYANFSGAERDIEIGNVSVTMENGTVWGTWSADDGVTWRNTTIPTTQKSHFPCLKSTTNPWGENSFSITLFCKAWSSYPSETYVLIDRFEAGLY